MQLGLTTNVFATALASGEGDLSALLDFAEEEGFSAMELRDADASLPPDEVELFVKDARGRRIDVTYAVENDMFASGDRQLVARAVERAALAGDGAILRILASQPALEAEGKKGYSRDEVERVASTARDYAALADESRVFLALEHAREPLYGDGRTYFGLHEIMDLLEEPDGPPRNLGITFDPANAVSRSICNAPATPERVFEFIEEHTQYIELVHFKTTRGGELTPTITDADIENEALFGALAKVYDGIVCIETPSAPGWDDCVESVTASLEYLRESGLMGYFAQKGVA